jgi:lysophospholipase L1-like esterase
MVKAGGILQRMCFAGLWLLTLALTIGARGGSQNAPQFPAPKSLGPVETYGRRIQRTMTLLATSAPGRRNTVKILFYGQSITEQTWSRLVADDLRRRFPNANLIIENRAIGGHSSPRLLKTMEADVLPFYPDLVIFHVYGDDGDYERIIRRIRRETAAEILIQTDHLRRTDDPAKEVTDPAKIVRSKEMWDSWMNYVFLPRIAQEYGAELVNQRELWKAYLLDHRLEPGALLKDGVHLNEHGNYLMAEIVKAYLRYDPKFPTAPWKELVKTYEVGKDARWNNGKLALDFEGNRVDVIVKPGGGAARAAAIRIDGKKPSEFPELYAFTRVTHYPQSSWPTMLRVQRGNPLLLEDWALTLTELSADYKQVKFTLAGSKTGDDGAGASAERFVSRSGRIVIDPEDWNLEYCLQVFKRPIAPGFKIEWKVAPLFVDEFSMPAAQDPSIETAVTLAQGLPNRMHRLEILGDARTPIAAVRVYRPAGMSSVDAK